MLRAPTFAPALTCAALLVSPIPAQEALARNGGLEITVVDENAPGLLPVLRAYAELDGAALLIGPQARSVLGQLPCGLSEPVRVEGGAARLLVEELLRWNGFVLSELGAEPGAMLGVHSLEGESGTNARYRAVEAGELHALAGNAALLVETVAELPHLDARQVTSSMRALMRPEWCNAMIAAGSPGSIVLRGPAQEVAEWLATLARLEALAAGALPATEEARHAQAAPGAEPEVAAREPAPEPEPGAPRSALEGAEVLLTALEEVSARHRVRLTELVAAVHGEESYPWVGVSFDVEASGESGLEATAGLLALELELLARASGAEVSFPKTEERAGPENGGVRHVIAEGAWISFPRFEPRPTPVDAIAENDLEPAYSIRAAAVSPDHEIGSVDMRARSRARKDGAQSLEFTVVPSDHALSHDLPAVRGFLSELDGPVGRFSVTRLSLHERGEASEAPRYLFDASLELRASI